VKAVLDTMVDLPHEEVLLNKKLLLVGEGSAKLKVQLPKPLPLEQVEDCIPKLPYPIQLRARPGARSVPDRLLPSVEGLPGVERTEVGTKRDGLVRVAGPVDGLDVLGAEPHQDQRGLTGDYGRQNASHLGRRIGRWPIALRQGVGGVRVRPRGVHDPGRELLDLGFRGCVSDTQDLVAEPDRGAIGRDEGGKRWAMFQKGFVNGF
jgi:hypothetical protein